MKDLQEQYEAYVAHLGPPTLRSEAAIREYMDSCRRRADPNIFFLVIDISKMSDTYWCYNTARHFGTDFITRADLFERIHPRWHDYYQALSLLIFRIGTTLLKDYLKFQAQYTINVPLRQSNGTYYWYTQFTRPLAFAANGNLTHFTKELRLLCTYDNLSPELPKISIGNNAHEQSQPEIQQAGQEALSNMLMGVVPRSSMTVLNAYRMLARRQGDAWAMPDKQEVENHLGMSRAGLNKALTRLNASVRECLPAIVTGSVADLVTFMNDIFGQPAR